MNSLVIIMEKEIKVNATYTYIYCRIVKGALLHKRIVKLTKLQAKKGAWIFL